MSFHQGECHGFKKEDKENQHCTSWIHGYTKHCKSVIPIFLSFHIQQKVRANVYLGWAGCKCPGAQAVPVKVSLQMALVKLCLFLIGCALGREVGTSAGAFFCQEALQGLWCSHEANPK